MPSAAFPRSRFPICRVSWLHFVLRQYPGCTGNDLLRMGLAEVRPLPSPLPSRRNPPFSRPSPLRQASAPAQTDEPRASLQAPYSPKGAARGWRPQTRAFPSPFPSPPLFLVFSPLFSDGFPLQYAGDRDSSSRRRRIRGSAKGSFIPPKKSATRRARHRTFLHPKPPRLRQRTTLTLCFLCRRADHGGHPLNPPPDGPDAPGSSMPVLRLRRGGVRPPPRERSAVLVTARPSGACSLRPLRRCRLE